MELPYDDNGKLASCAWPGGYPIYYMDKGGSVLCWHCANDSLEDEDEIDKFKPVAWGINYEDKYVTCDECSESIDCAYDD